MLFQIQVAAAAAVAQQQYVPVSMVDQSSRQVIVAVSTQYSSSSFGYWSGASCPSKQGINNVTYYICLVLS